MLGSVVTMFAVDAVVVMSASEASMLVAAADLLLRTWPAAQRLKLRLMSMLVLLQPALAGPVTVPVLMT